MRIWDLWDTQVAHINNTIAKNTEILFKLRHCISIHTLKQLYYTLIYPYLNYALMCWGTASKFRLDTLQVKQKKCIRSLFFVRNRKSPHVYYKVLEILKLKNIFNLKICILFYRIKYIKTKITSFSFMFQKFNVMIPDTLASTIYTDHNPEHIMDYLDSKPYRQGYGEKYPWI